MRRRPSAEGQRKGKKPAPQTAFGSGSERAVDPSAVAKKRWQLLSGRAYTKEQTREHKKIIVALLNRKLSFEEVARAAHEHFERQVDMNGKPLNGCSIKRAAKLVRQVVDEWHEVDRKHLGRYKARAVRFALDAVRWTRYGEKDAEGKWISRPNMAAHVQAIDHLAKIEGTFEPIQIDVMQARSEQVRLLLQSISEDRLIEAIKEADEMYAKLLPENVIDTTGEPVDG